MLLQIWVTAEGFCTCSVAVPPVVRLHTVESPTIAERSGVSVSILVEVRA